jgi:hypothetical protein
VRGEYHQLARLWACGAHAIGERLEQKGMRVI